jgi:hypothetical protein
MWRKVLTNHLEIQEDEAKVVQAKKGTGNATGSLFAYPLSQSIPSMKEGKLARIDRR